LGFRTSKGSSIVTDFALSDWGWRSAPNPLSSTYPISVIEARVIVQQRDLWMTISSAGELLADRRGRNRHQDRNHQNGDDAPAVIPVVGDFVLLSPRRNEGRATIHQVLERRTVLQRKAAGKEVRPQVIAANIDTVLIAVPLDLNVNLRLVERQLVTVWESGATPVIVATKADVPGAAPERLVDAALGAEVVVVSASEKQGLERLNPWLRPTDTLAIIGPSGAGKSTLTNALLGLDHMSTQQTRDADGKGRHTTTHRELVKLPGGAMLIDTPGMRELGLWNGGSDDSSGVAEVFDDVSDLMTRCRFHNCEHETEPGCAVRAAVEDGSLDVERLHSFHKLSRELAFVDRQHDKRLQSEERKKWAKKTQAYKQYKKP
jgi:ribosome biogenesis GTPase / thiamine phosphate phosphatase